MPLAGACRETCPGLSSGMAIGDSVREVDRLGTDTLSRREGGSARGPDCLRFSLVSNTLLWRSARRIAEALGQRRSLSYSTDRKMTDSIYSETRELNLRMGRSWKVNGVCKRGSELVSRWCMVAPM